MKNLVLAIFALAAPVASVSAEGGNSGLAKEPAAFLNLGLGARPSALGKAYTAIADDASSSYWNPSGLARLRQYEFQSMSYVLGDDQKFYFFSLGVPIRIHLEPSGLDDVEDEGEAFKDFFLPISEWNFSLSFGSALYRVGDIARRDGLGTKLGEFSDHEYVYFFSMGHDVFRGLSLGYTYRYHVQRTESSTAKGGGFDFGAQYRPHFFEGMSLGLTMMNVGAGEMQWQTTDDVGGTDKYEESFPRKMRGGLAYHFRNPDLLMALDVHAAKEQDPTYHGGVEFKMFRMLNLRAGIDQKTPAAGIGLDKELWGRMRILFDYALTLSNDALNSTHRVSSSIRY